MAKQMNPLDIQPGQGKPVAEINLQKGGEQQQKPPQQPGQEQKPQVNLEEEVNALQALLGLLIDLLMAKNVFKEEEFQTFIQNKLQKSQAPNVMTQGPQPQQGNYQAAGYPGSADTNGMGGPAGENRRT